MVVDAAGKELLCGNCGAVPYCSVHLAESAAADALLEDKVVYTDVGVFVKVLNGVLVTFPVDLNDYYNGDYQNENKYNGSNNYNG